MSDDPLDRAPADAKPDRAEWEEAAERLVARSRGELSDAELEAIWRGIG